MERRNATLPAVAVLVFSSPVYNNNNNNSNDNNIID